MNLIVASFLIAFLLITTCHSIKIESKIYEAIKKYRPCILLTNATHQIGCTSDIKGNRGVLHFVDNDNDLDWIVNKGTHDPYIPLLNSSMFTRPVMDKLMESKKVSGVLVIHHGVTDSPTGGFSPDDSCPMDNFGIYGNHKEYGSCKKVKWNPLGNGMSFVYYGIPIFALIDEDETKTLIKCYNDHNTPDIKGSINYPLCAVEMKDFMFAAKDTPTCKRKTEIPNAIGSTYCDPLEDKNIYGTLYPLVGEVEKDEIVMAATKIDSTAFFHDIALGADNGVTGIITLLAAAYSLGEYKREMIRKNITEKLKPIMFSFFNGESWDYIGSSKMVFDMGKNKFPYSEGNKNAKFNISSDKLTDDISASKFDTSQIGHFIEISQVGLNKDVYVHTDPISQENQEVKKKIDAMLDEIKKAAKATELPIVEADTSRKRPLPPASFQRFLRKRKDIPGVVFADHEKNYSNIYYNSRFDNILHVGFETVEKKVNNNSYLKVHGPLSQKLTNLAITVATTLYKLASDGKEPQVNFTLPANLTANLLTCFLLTSNCPSFKEVLDDKSTKPFSGLPIGRYISVGQIENMITKTIHRLLALYTGEWLDASQCKGTTFDKLPKVFSYITLRGTNFINNTHTCVKSCTYTTPAISPAFELKDYTSTEYSTWTESMWYGDIGVKLYLVANPMLEGIMLAAGIVLLVTSFIAVYFAKKNSNILFTPNVVNIN